MRLWSLHPQYLDVKGLTAAWREGLLAQNVLQGRTRGYRNHPQLQRFRAQPEPLAAVAVYLSAIWVEAEQRGYSFDRTKIVVADGCALIPVTRGQISYERQHLLHKLSQRDRERYQRLLEIIDPRPHPLFFIVEGIVESWEIIP
jgi:Pyrimidine dimer DNA glycosylase